MIQEACLRAVFSESLKLSAQESCLIVADTIKEDIGRQFFRYASTITPRSEFAVMEPSKEHGAEPPENISALMSDYDVQILITDKSLSHTQARRRASLAGARIASMPTITEAIANRCIDIDYNRMKDDCGRLCKALISARSVRIRTELGTDIEVIVNDGSRGIKRVYGEDGGVFDYKGAFGNLPEGEVSFSPLGAEGQYVVDATFPGLGLLTAPLIFKVKDGYVRDIGGRDAHRVIRRLDAVGRQAYFVAEVGIGTNPKAIITGSVLEDEKVLGTVHIAVGNNLSYGGSNDVPLHLDGVMRDPDIYVDLVPIMKKGKAIW